MTQPVVAGFVQRMSRGYRLRRAAADSARVAVVLAIVVSSVAIAVPTRLGVAAAVAGGALVTIAAGRFWRLRFDAAEVDARLGLRGRLRTWLDVRATLGSGPMVDWLERELAERLVSVPERALAALGRRRLGPARSGLVLLLVLLLLRCLVLPPLPDGVIELAGRESSAGAPSGSGGQESKPASGTSEPGDREPPQAPGDAPQPEVPQPSGPELPPEALVMDPPVRDDFVVPSFVGAGDGRKTTAPAAGIDEAPAGAAGASSRGGAGGGNDTPSPPIDPRVEFERALEEALRSRHVPAEEQPFVRRWFRSLLEEKR